ncbi:putative Transcriptional regulator Medusa [Seiridium cardinale]
MSTSKFGGYPFEPHFHPDRPIIIDPDVESPETVALRYEEEAARASGGGQRGDSPGLLTASAYSKSQPPQMHSSYTLPSIGVPADSVLIKGGAVGFESSRAYQDSQYQYPAQSFPTHQTENVAAHLNQMAFAANSSAAPYVTPVLPTLISPCDPSVGITGTKVMIKITAPYDLLAVTNHFYLVFGQQRCAAHAVRDHQDNSGYGYVISGDAPHFSDTRSASISVPLSLLIEMPDAQGPTTLEVGTFTYHDGQVGPADPAPEDITRAKVPPSPEHREDTPKQEHHRLQEPPTNTYGYPPEAQQAAETHYDPNYASTGSNGNMMAAYHRSSYADDYSRHIPPPIKTTSLWGSYGPSLTSMRSPAMGHTNHTTITRPSIASLPAPASANPQLVRTSTLQTSGSPSASFNPYTMFQQSKAKLNIAGDLESMAAGWTTEECDNRRRIVLFRKHQQGAILTASFKPVSVNERPPNSICISCIYWQEKGECFVTSVDTIHLLEQLVAAPSRFTVEEKNRIRRNLEGFRPLTVSKAKADSEEFFKIIMAFPNPKPRNIEKDVKVFPWKILSQALKKIISKYSASPSSQVGPSTGQMLLTPVSNPSPGLYQHSHHPPTPSESSYGHHDHHNMTSPRSLSGGPSSWHTYSTRPLSPSLKSHSPTTGGIRIPSLSSYGTSDGRHSTSSGYGIASQPQTRWDTTSTNGYIDASGIPAYTSHHQSHVYSTAGYGDGGQRA